MRISALKIKNFKSFKQEEVIPFNDDLIAIIGYNSSGKTAALEALRKIFGINSWEREITKQDFHIPKDVSPSDIKRSDLSIEVIFHFSEKNGEKEIPHFFKNMIVDEPKGEPYLRIRLESTWEESKIDPEGIIETHINFITVPVGSAEQDDSKTIFSPHYKSLFQLIYVPAIRKPSEQLKFASGTILYRLLKKINWDSEELKSDFVEKLDEINALFEKLPGFTNIQTELGDSWKTFHKDKRYSDANFKFGNSDLDSILKKLDIEFSPPEGEKPYRVDDLGEGLRSLFYITLVCTLLKIESEIDGVDVEKPLLTMLAIEEPENHIAPQLLGRVIKNLKVISEQSEVQVVLTSHTPAIIKRITPEAICHFRINDNYTTVVKTITLPVKEDEAYKYIKEAVQNYPEIYFAKLVLIGEGDSEEIVFNKLSKLYNTDFDDNTITFVPLGHRFVNHIWKLLNTLDIPYITLLDLDREREGGGWGRIKYALQQLIDIGADRDELLLTTNGVLSEDKFEKMHTWDVTKITTLDGWIKRLNEYNVFYATPLDLDFLLLKEFFEEYKIAVPKGGGPEIPDKGKEASKFAIKLENAIHATLKSDDAKGATYTEEEKELMIWYNYHFLYRGKPSTHLLALSAIEDDVLKKRMPKIFIEIFDKLKEVIDSK